MDSAALQQADKAKLEKLEKIIKDAIWVKENDIDENIVCDICLDDVE